MSSLPWVGSIISVAEIYASEVARRCGFDVQANGYRLCGRRHALSQAPSRLRPVYFCECPRPLGARVTAAGQTSGRRFANCGPRRKKPGREGTEHDRAPWSSRNEGGSTSGW